MEFRIEDQLGDIQGHIQDLRRFFELQTSHQTQQVSLVKQHGQNPREEVKVIPRSQLHYDKENDFVGTGAFGNVIRGTYSGGPVAIKILSREYGIKEPEAGDRSAENGNLHRGYLSQITGGSELLLNLNMILLVHLN